MPVKRGLQTDCIRHSHLSRGWFVWFDQQSLWAVQENLGGQIGVGTGHQREEERWPPLSTSWARGWDGWPAGWRGSPVGEFMAALFLTQEDYINFMKYVVVFASKRQLHVSLYI